MKPQLLGCTLQQIQSHQQQCSFLWVQGKEQDGRRREREQGDRRRELELGAHKRELELGAHKRELEHGVQWVQGGHKRGQEHDGLGLGDHKLG